MTSAWMHEVEQCREQLPTVRASSGSKWVTSWLKRRVMRAPCDLLFDQGVVAAPVGLDKDVVDVSGCNDALLVATGGDEAGVTEVAAQA